MITANDLIKMAQEEIIVNPDEEKNPLRKVHDAVLNGAKATVGAIGAGIAGLQSLDNRVPPRTIE